MYEQIRLFLLDVDGVLTDGGIVLDAAGVETKTFDVRDGTALKWLQRHGVAVGLLTGRTSAVVDLRARELGIDLVVQGAQDKLPAFEKLLAARQLTAAECAYMGDDLLDLPVLRRAALSFAPADARPEVRERVTVVTASPGGRGAVREAAEFLLKARGSWDGLLAHYLQ